MALLYSEGRGVPLDYAEAATWCSKAADQGDARAQVMLGAMYLVGHGVPQDYVQAHMWFNLAASRSSDKDALAHDNAIKGRDFAAARMTQTQIAEAQKLAREWKPKSER